MPTLHTRLTQWSIIVLTLLKDKVIKGYDLLIHCMFHLFFTQDSLPDSHQVATT